MLIVLLSPVEYIPRSGSIRYYESLSVEVTLPPDARNVDFRLGAPVVSVSPARVTVRISPGQLVEKTVTIGNLGNIDLDYRIECTRTSTEADPVTSAVESAPWLTCVPEAGSIGPQETETLVLTIDARELTEGIYEATLFVNSNDPINGTEEVDVTLRCGLTCFIDALR